jgi:hypothetical protein
VPLSLRRDADEARVCRDRRPNSVPDPDPLDRCSVSQTGWDNVLPAPFAWGEDPDGGGRPTGRAEGRRKLISARQRRSARTLIRGWADRTRLASRGPGRGPANRPSPRAPAWEKGSDLWTRPSTSSRPPATSSSFARRAAAAVTRRSGTSPLCQRRIPCDVGSIPTTQQTVVQRRSKRRLTSRSTPRWFTSPIGGSPREHGLPRLQ